MTERVRADFWFDPVCPWAWMASRWMLEVAEQRPVDVSWHVMSLSYLNKGRQLDAFYTELMDRAWANVRVLTAARLAHGEEVIFPLYESMGRQIHLEQNKNYEEVIDAALAEVGLPAALAEAKNSTDFDEELAKEHHRGMDQVGDEVGTPVISVEGTAFFGPVVSPAPKGEAAAKLWDGVLLVAQTDGFFELKRSRTRDPIFDDSLLSAGA